jgi:hypothetical protein
MKPITSAGSSRSSVVASGAGPRSVGGRVMAGVGVRALVGGGVAVVPQISPMRSVVALIASRSIGPSASATSRSTSTATE